MVCILHASFSSEEHLPFSNDRIYLVNPQQPEEVAGAYECDPDNVRGKIVSFFLCRCTHVYNSLRTGAVLCRQSSAYT